MRLKEVGEWVLYREVYQCHPETCSHWDHPPYVIRYKGAYHSDYQTLKEAENAFKNRCNLK